MIETLFTYDEFEQTDDQDFQYYSCVLVSQIGPWEKGSRFHTIGISYDEGILVLFDEGGIEINSYSLTLTIGKDVSLKSLDDAQD